MTEPDYCIIAGALNGRQATFVPGTYTYDESPRGF